MKNRTEFVEMSEATAFGVRDMLRQELSNISKAPVERVIKVVQEFLEMEEICSKFSKEEEEKELILPVPEMPKVIENIYICRSGVDKHE